MSLSERLFSSFSILFFIVALALGAALVLLSHMSPIDAFLLSFIVCGIGFEGLWLFAGNFFISNSTASSMGWPADRSIPEGAGIRGPRIGRRSVHRHLDPRKLLVRTRIDECRLQARDVIDTPRPHEGERQPLGPGGWAIGLSLRNRRAAHNAGAGLHLVPVLSPL